MKKEFVKKAFTDDAQAWVSDGYNYHGYNYPVGYQRMRIVSKILDEVGSKLSVADLGCGGGNVALMLAKAGHMVDAVDQSPKMIEIAKEARDKESKDVKGRLNLHCNDLEMHGLQHGSYDVVISMGVIGYLEDDGDLFRQAVNLLKPGGLFVVSTRNRLFNLGSISHRTVAEVENGNAADLMNEFFTIDSTAPVETTNEFIKRLKQFSESLPDCYEEGGQENQSPSEMNDLSYDVVDTLEPRQHTPSELDGSALQYEFKCLGHYGVHPHIINPRLNKSLPPTFFNRLSDCLEPFENLPISLTWSSVLIGTYEFRK